MFDHLLIWAAGVIKWDGQYSQILITFCLSIGSTTVITHYPQHVISIVLIKRERASLCCQFC